MTTGEKHPLQLHGGVILETSGVPGLSGSKHLTGEPGWPPRRPLRQAPAQPSLAQSQASLLRSVVFRPDSS